MQCSDTSGKLPAVHIDTGALLLAQKIQRIADVLVEQNDGGNGEIIFKLKVNGGKISRILDFAGKWFPRKSSRER